MIEILRYKDVRRIEMVFIKENIWMEKDMEEVSLLGIMGRFLMGNGGMERKMVLEHGNLQKGIIIKGIG